MDGIGLLETVLRMQARIPVNMITGFGVWMKEECRGIGAMGILNKPFRMYGLLSLIEEVGKKTN
jgi:FixJ family two-component response regulator